MLARRYGFYLIWLFIVFVSTYDGWLVLAHRPGMGLFEQNPFGRWLIRIWGDDIWLLLALKALGTICVASFLLVLYWQRPLLAWIVCAAVAAFQLGLLVYLNAY
jgi:hypothetical protein